MVVVENGVYVRALFVLVLEMVCECLYYGVVVRYVAVVVNKLMNVELLAWFAVRFGGVGPSLL